MRGAKSPIHAPAGAIAGRGRVLRSAMTGIAGPESRIAPAFNAGHAAPIVMQAGCNDAAASSSPMEPAKIAKDY